MGFQIERMSVFLMIKITTNLSGVYVMWSEHESNYWGNAVWNAKIVDTFCLCVLGWVCVCVGAFVFAGNCGVKHEYTPYNCGGTTNCGAPQLRSPHFHE